MMDKGWSKGGADLDEWAIVNYYNTDSDRETDYNILIRKKYHWDAQRLDGHWEYLATGLTHKQAMEFAKLFKD